MTIDPLLNVLERSLDAFFALIPRQLPSASKLNKVQLIAHRGAHDHRCGLMENTLQAFDYALDLGCSGIEFDIRSTLDGELVVHHDADLSRIFGIKQRIDKLKWQELKKLAPDVPHLHDVLARYQGQLHYFIELKSPFDQEELLAQALNDFKPVKEYHLLSLETEIFQKLEHLPKEALLLVAVHNNINHFYQQALKYNYGGVIGHYLLFRRSLRDGLMQAGKTIGVGYVASKNSLLREVNRDIDWLFTNSAEKVSHILHALKDK